MQQYCIQAAALEIALLAANARVAYFRQHLRRAVRADLAAVHGGESLDDAPDADPSGDGVAAPEAAEVVLLMARKCTKSMFCSVEVYHPSGVCGGRPLRMHTYARFAILGIDSMRDWPLQLHVTQLWCMFLP
jgi:hypothetical protein